MDWSNDLIIEFLEQYQLEPVIWNPKNRLHKHRNSVTDAWERIRTSMSVDFSVADLKRKRESLMASYRSLLSKQRRSLKSGAIGDSVYMPSWFAFPLMNSFLGPLYENKDSLNTEILDETEENSNESTTIQEVDLDSPRPSKRSRTQVQTTKNHEESIYDTEFVTTHHNAEEDDEYKSYGRTIGYQVKNLGQTQRHIAEKLISEVIFYARIEKLTPGSKISCAFKMEDEFD